QAFLTLLFLPRLEAGRCGEAARIKTDGKRILVDGSPLFLKGVDYSPFIAGDAPWTGATKVNFLNDLCEIRNTLHANAVRIYDPLPKEFYDAARQTGLWVIQGIYLPNAPNFLAVLGDMKGTVTAAIQAIHDRGGADVILAYAIGSGLDTQNVA